MLYITERAGKAEKNHNYKKKNEPQNIFVLKSEKKNTPTGTTTLSLFFQISLKIKNIPITNKEKANIPICHFKYVTKKIRMGSNI